MIWTRPSESHFSLAKEVVLPEVPEVQKVVVFDDKDPNFGLDIQQKEDGRDQSY